MGAVRRVLHITTNVRSSPAPKQKSIHRFVGASEAEAVGDLIGVDRLVDAERLELGYGSEMLQSSRSHDLRPVQPQMTERRHWLQVSHAIIAWKEVRHQFMQGTTTIS